MEHSNEINPNQVNLNVKCEVGQVSLTLDDLMQLQTGSVVEMSRWPNQVKLSVNGVYIAEGMLVEIDGMLGVKITERVNVV
jgi:flagellar motor switch/type III secretory pathway protein FliN